LLTDRYAGTTTPCPYLGNYCGGTFQGIEQQLDYIVNMGFNAIWISPIVKNMEGGYHGYWLSDLWQVNEHFGTAKDLKNLVDACHKRDIYVMVDIVLNHVAPIGMDFTQISPFNSSAHYHPTCNIVDFQNQTQMELCRLDQLPDLDQTNPFVYQQLTQWLEYIVKFYGFDGIRLDTVPYISQSFYKSVMSDVIIPRTGYTYIVGEVFDSRIDYSASYANIIGATLNYPLFFTLRSMLLLLLYLNVLYF
jgi:alpha-amylase